MRRTKIVATVGPASLDPPILRRMIDAGMNVARIGLAHGTLETHLASYHSIRNTASEMGAEVSILVDLPGPKVRCAAFADGGVDIADGAELLITSGRDSSTATVAANKGRATSAGMMSLIVIFFRLTNTSPHRALSRGRQVDYRDANARSRTRSR